MVEGLTALFRRLRTEVERAQASPALRLLDDLLLVMDSDWGSSEAARLEAARERMDAAFDPNAGAPSWPRRIAAGARWANAGPTPAQTIDIERFCMYCAGTLRVARGR